MRRPQQDEQRVRLDRDTIVATALTLLDEVGLDGLSTRLLANRLGVQSPALYWHFVSKRDLVDAMADAMLDQAGQPEPPPPGDDAHTWLVTRGHAFRRALLAHRDGARVHAGTRPPATQLASIDMQLGALTAAGFSPRDAARAVLAVSRFTVGWVLEEQAASDRTRQHERHLDLGRYPMLEAARAILEQHDPDTDFDYGLRSLVAGSHPASHAPLMPDTDSRGCPAVPGLRVFNACHNL